MRIAPSYLACFGISNTRLLALQCSKVLPKLKAMAISQILKSGPKLQNTVTVHVSVQQITTLGGTQH